MSGVWCPALQERGRGWGGRGCSQKVAGWGAAKQEEGDMCPCDRMQAPLPSWEPGMQRPHPEWQRGVLGP